jgi:hypothetical protein
LKSVAVLLVAILLPGGREPLSGNRTWPKKEKELIDVRVLPENEGILELCARRTGKCAGEAG